MIYVMLAYPIVWAFTIALGIRLSVYFRHAAAIERRLRKFEKEPK